MHYDPSNPLIVQGDRSVLVEVDNPRYAEARDALAPFAELEKSPEHIHTYRLTPLSLWNAAAAGMTADAMLDVLRKYSKFPVPSNLSSDLAEVVSRYGRVRLERMPESSSATAVSAVSAGPNRLTQPWHTPPPPSGSSARTGRCWKNWPVSRRSSAPRRTARRYELPHRGPLPRRPEAGPLAVGYPAEDVAGYTEGAALPIHLRTVARSGLPFHVRDYQREAADVFYAGGDARGGSGVVVLPCGAGKTVVGIAAMALMNRNTLVLTTGVTAVKQWRREILDKTDLTEEQVCEYTGDTKEIGPVTLATYQILTHRNDKTEEFPHFQLFDQRDWGLIIYDEVHLLPAPVFRVTAHIQARRRLGLTATLVREDGREADVFSLIGPKKYDVPWRELETRGWIAEATCAEVRVAMPEPLRMEYAVAEWRDKYRIASENPAKDDVVAALLERYTDSRVLIIGQYLKQLRRLRKRFNLPLITGQTPNSEREDLYNKFRMARCGS